MKREKRIARHYWNREIKVQFVKDTAYAILAIVTFIGAMYAPLVF